MGNKEDRIETSMINVSYIDDACITDKEKQDFSEYTCCLFGFVLFLFTSMYTISRSRRFFSKP